MQHKYEWLYLYAFVNPQTGESHWYLLPTVNATLLSWVLADLATDIGASQDHAHAIVLDRAGWHQAKELDIPEGIELIFLPPYSPELQPAERLWQLTDEPLLNRHFDNIDQLQDKQAIRCTELMSNPDLISRHTLFHWWPLT